MNTETKRVVSLRKWIALGCYGIVSVLMASSGFAEYPQSTQIKGVSFDFATTQRYAKGSDIWPMTWSSDNNVYTSWGDGGGFAGDIKAARVSLGMGKLSGNYPGLVGHNIWGATGYADKKATFKGKATGMISVGTKLYAWVNFRRANDGGTPGHAVLAWSSNKGASWTKAGWQWDSSFIADPTFLNFGKNNANALDGYVYCYASDTYKGIADLRNDKRNHVFLFRVPKDKLSIRSAYQFYKGTGASGPIWTSNIAELKPVFTNQGKITWSLSVTWFPGLNRYLLFNNNSTASQEGAPSSLAIYDAPKPWGPWTKVVEYKDWIGNKNYVFSYYPIPKLMKVKDAKHVDFVLAFSGLGAYDSLNIIQGHLSK